MHLALLSEFGARAIYDHMSRRTRNEKFKEVLVRLNNEGAETVRRLREVMASMGARPKRTSFRRRALARILAYVSLVSGPRPVLRLCHHAEETVSRWYAEYAIFLSKLGDLERAAEMQSLHGCKRMHAQEVLAWMELARHR
ncbi:MAG: rubrerythrin [Planctomycetota bacterium]|jgi:rubrerythrin